MKNIHTLFTAGPGGPITTRSLDYSKGGYPWIVKVRAASVQKARGLLIHQIVSSERGPGVISVDRSSRPGQWPWKMNKDTVAPQWKS
jgi:hypothetical protein